MFITTKQKITGNDNVSLYERRISSEYSEGMVSLNDILANEYKNLNNESSFDLILLSASKINDGFVYYIEVDNFDKSTIIEDTFSVIYDYCNKSLFLVIVNDVKHLDEIKDILIEKSSRFGWIGIGDKSERIYAATFLNEAGQNILSNLYSNFIR